MYWFFIIFSELEAFFFFWAGEEVTSMQPNIYFPFYHNTEVSVQIEILKDDFTFYRDKAASVLLHDLCRHGTNNKLI